MLMLNSSRRDYATRSDDAELTAYLLWERIYLLSELTAYLLQRSLLTYFQSLQPTYFKGAFLLTFRAYLLTSKELTYLLSELAAVGHGGGKSDAASERRFNKILTTAAGRRK